MHKHSAGPVLDIRGVSKLFGSNAAVENMDLAVGQGEIFGFLGPNGAGKTTTIKLILDILRPTRGTIELFGISNRHTAETHRRLGYLSGDMIIDSDLTGRQYLDFVAHRYGGNSTARRERLAELLQADVDVRVGAYSRGNKQKIGLIAALMHNPDLLILDEPSSGFDPLIQEIFVELIEKYREAGGTVFMSSHSLSEVQKLCDRVGFIRAGQLAGVSDINELSQKAAKRVRATIATEHAAHLRQAVARMTGLKLTDEKTVKHDTILTFTYSGAAQPLLRAFAVFSLKDFVVQEPELEDIFLGYYERRGSPDTEKEGAAQ